MAEVKQTAGQFAINLRDIALGAAVAGITAGIQIIVDIVQAFLIDHTPIQFDWREIGNVSLLAALGYLGKNFVTKSKTIVVGPKDDVHVTKTTDGAVIVKADTQPATPDQNGTGK